MTREEFIREVDCMSELKDFCYEYCLDTCDDIVDEDYVHEYINECLVDWARNDNWTDLRDRLNELSDEMGYTWYKWDDYYGRYEPFDEDDFDDYKDEVLRCADEHGDIWEEEEPEDEDCVVVPQPADPEEEEPLPEEECGVGDMLSESFGCLRIVSAETENADAEEEAAFLNLVF